MTTQLPSREKLATNRAREIQIRALVPEAHRKEVQRVEISPPRGSTLAFGFGHHQPLSPETAPLWRFGEKTPGRRHLRSVFRNLNGEGSIDGSGNHRGHAAIHGPGTIGRQGGGLLEAPSTENSLGPLHFETVKVYVAGQPESNWKSRFNWVTFCDAKENLLA